MGDKTGIQWTDATWNPVVGCTIKSPGCTNCYAMKEAHRLAIRLRMKKYADLTTIVNGRPVWNGVVRVHADALDQPLRWRRPRLIFVNSMSDLFHESLDFPDIDRVMAIAALAHWHTLQILTKRSDRMRAYSGDMAGLSVPARAARLVQALPDNVRTGALKSVALSQIGTTWPLPNIWFGASTEDQARADERLPDLAATPAAKRFVSYEPALGRVDFRPWLPSLDQIIFGGESGPDKRPVDLDWARSTRDQCAASGRCAFFMKQVDKVTPIPDDLTQREIPQVLA